MTQPVQSDGVGVAIGRESTLGTKPTAGWMQFQVNPAGIQQLTRQNVVAEHDPLSPNMTPERDQVVGYDSSPKLVGDLTMDMLLYLRELVFRSNVKHSGGTGLSFFRPTAVTATGYTVAASGNLADNILIFAAGFSTAANNGLKVLAGTSIATEIKTAGLTAEAAPPSNATVRVAGIQGVSDDLAIDANGDLTSGGGAGPHIDFTTLGLQSGQKIRIGDETSGAAYAFGSSYNGTAVIDTIAAAKLTLKLRSWTVGAADTGAGKTIRVLFESYIQSRPITDADYLDTPSIALELSEPNAEAASDSYTYLAGQAVDSFEIDVPSESKMTATIGLVGMTVDDPTGTRASGPDTAYDPLAAQIFSTDAKIIDERLVKQSDESSLSAEINTSKISYKNNVKPQKQHGTSGAAGLIYGQYMPGVSAQVYLLQNDLTRAINGNTDCVYMLTAKCSDGGFSIDFPMCKVRKGDKSYQRASSVMLDVDIVPKRDPATGILQSMSTFAYLP